MATQGDGSGRARSRQVERLARSNKTSGSLTLSKVPWRAKGSRRGEGVGPRYLHCSLLSLFAEHFVHSWRTDRIFPIAMDSEHRALRRNHLRERPRETAKLSRLPDVRPFISTMTGSLADDEA
jgi:hypothetical protein